MSDFGVPLRGRGRRVITSRGPRKVTDANDDEEWPTVGAAASRVDSPSRQQPNSETPPPQAQSAASVLQNKQPIRTAGKPSSSSDTTAGRKPAAAPVKDFGETKAMAAEMKFLTEGLEWADLPVEYFSETNSQFVVIGSIGPQGTGKSTLLSMVGGNDAFDMYREAVETCKHQTAGIQVYITKSRVILLDCQPVLSPSLVDEAIRVTKRYSYEYKSVENFVEVESIQLLTFLLQVCHTVLVCNDWFVDMNLVRLVRNAEADAFVHQRAKHDDFQQRTIENRVAILDRLFKDSNCRTQGCLSLSRSSFQKYRDDGLSESARNFNYFVLSDMKLRGQKDEGGDSKVSSGSGSVTVAEPTSLPDYEILVRDFSLLVRSLPRPAFALGGAKFTEKQWYQYAQRAWEAVRRSNLIVEYARTLL